MANMRFTFCQKLTTQILIGRKDLSCVINQMKVTKATKDELKSMKTHYVGEAKACLL